MKIRMIKTENGSVDGIRVKAYEAGKEYDLTRTDGERELANAFVNARMAVLVDAMDISSVAEEVAAEPGFAEQIDAQGLNQARAKAVELATENKATPVTERKRGRRKG